MVGRLMDTLMWSIVESEGGIDVDLYPAQKPSALIINRLTLQKAIIVDWFDWKKLRWQVLSEVLPLCLIAADRTNAGDDIVLFEVSGKRYTIGSIRSSFILFISAAS